MDADALELSDDEQSYAPRAAPPAVSQPFPPAWRATASQPDASNPNAALQPDWPASGAHAAMRPPDPAAASQPAERPSSSQVSRRRIPGPAGALETNGVLDVTASGTQAWLPTQQMRDKPLHYWHRTAAWIELETASDEASQGFMEVRSKLVDVIRIASTGPPPVPPRVPVLCVLIKAIGTKESSGDDVLVTLADETGEMNGTLHGAIFNEQPGLLVSGAAMALKDVPVFSLAPYSHHLIIHPNSVVRVVAPPHATKKEARSKGEAGDLARRIFPGRMLGRVCCPWPARVRWSAGRVPPWELVAARRASQQHPPNQVLRRGRRAYGTGTAPRHLSTKTIWAACRGPLLNLPVNHVR